MRKVKFTYKNENYLDTQAEGFFHKFVGGDRSSPEAIVELEDGKVKLVDATTVQFVSAPAANVVNKKCTELVGKIYERHGAFPKKKVLSTQKVHEYVLDLEADILGALGGDK